MNVNTVLQQRCLLKCVIISNRGFAVKSDQIFLFFSTQLSHFLQVTGSQLRKCLIMMENLVWIS